MKKEFFPKLTFFLILILGGILRIFCLGTMPGGMHQDESFVAWNSFAIFHEQMDSAGHILPIYMADWGDGHSALYVWLTLPFVALGGGHINAFLARLPQVIVSIFTLAAVYGILKHVLNQKAALWGMFLLAVCPWHITMSRWGLDANLAPGFLMFGFYFFIKALEQEKYFLLSALFYGLSLYAYAVVWPIVPVLVLLQSSYALMHKKMRINRYSIFSAILLFLLALPLLLFIMVNSEFLPEIRLPFMTIPRMGGYRGGEVAFTPVRMYTNLRTALSLLWHQNTGAPYDILLPWGLFYDIGRFFIVLGAAALGIQSIRGLISRRYQKETFLFIQLLGGGLQCLLVTAVLHQINSLYIPLVLCEAYGIWQLSRLIRNRHAIAANCVTVALILAYLLCLAGFQKDYYTSYRELTNAWFAAGLQDCVKYARNICEQKGLSTITAEKGAQWPRLLLYLETYPSEYLDSVVYDTPPAPASFSSGGILVRTRIDYGHLDPESVYIIYYTDTDTFQENYELKQFYDWYVAVPSGK